MFVFVLFCFYFTRFSVANFNNPLGETLENCSQLPLFVLFIINMNKTRAKEKRTNLGFSETVHLPLP